ncbi:MAG: nitrile hydratase accessory protein [Pseudomonadales bacterium]
MTAPSREEVLNERLEAQGAAAPPMANGELVFEEPWQGRVFGMAHTLCDAGLFTWDEFRDALIVEIEVWESTNPSGTEYRYYERFLAALETILNAKGICEAPLLQHRFEEFQARPAGHDHHH